MSPLVRRIRAYTEEEPNLKIHHHDQEPDLRGFLWDAGILLACAIGAWWFFFGVFYWLLMWGQ